MPKIWEMLDIGQIAELVPDVQAGLELIREDGPDRPLRIRKEFQTDVGVPLVRTVHAIMWSKASKANLPQGFSRSYRGTVTSILRDNLHVTGDLVALSSQVGRVLSVNGMAVNHGGKGLGALYWMRPWDSKVEINWHEGQSRPDKKLDAQVAKQEARNGAPQPVTTSVDLGVIPKPKDATPEAVLEYVGKLVAAHHRLEEMYEQSQVEVASLKTQIEEIDARAEAKVWDVGSALEAIVGS